MKIYIKQKSPVIFLLMMLLFDFMNNQVIEAQDNWRCPMLGTLNGPVVIFKADDYFWNGVYGGEGENWTKFFNIIRNENICTDINVITGWTTWNWDEANERIMNLYQETYLNSLNDNVHRFDFLGHTKDHENMVCKDYDAQYYQIQTSQDAFHNNLGFDSHGLVTPYNTIDQTTKNAIDDYNTNNDDLLKIWMNYGFSTKYCDGRDPGPLIDYSGWNFLSLEYGPDYSHILLSTNFLEQGDTLMMTDYFIANYDNVYAKCEIIIMEIHPASWRDQSAFDAFTNMIAFLKTKNALFVTPDYIYNKANVEHYCGDYYDIENVNAVSSLTAGTTFQCPNTFVHDAANVSFTASKEISLKPGFTAEYGSTFDASIVPKVGLKSQYAQKVKPIEEVEPSEIKVNVYPNPNNGIFTVDFGNQQDKGKLIVISDLYGHEIKRINSTSSMEIIDLSNDPGGIYVIKILSNNRFKTIKIVKDH